MWKSIYFIHLLRVPKEVRATGPWPKKDWAPLLHSFSPGLLLIRITFVRASGKGFRLHAAWQKVLGLQGSKTPPPPFLPPSPPILGTLFTWAIAELLGYKLREPIGTCRCSCLGLSIHCVHTMSHHFFTRLRKKGLRINDTIGSTGKISNTLLIILVFTVCNKITTHRLSRYFFFNLFSFQVCISK